jgi:hypothetical protein
MTTQSIGADLVMAGMAVKNIVGATAGAAVTLGKQLSCVYVT